ERRPLGFYDHNVELERGRSFGFVAVREDDLAAFRVACRFMQTATTAGLQPEWSGDPGSKIFIKKRWARRRFTHTNFHPAAVPELSEVKHRYLGNDDEEAKYVAEERW